MPTTSRGAPYPAPNAANNVPGDIQALATWANDNPGIAILTTAQRDALTGGARWEGRIIYNSDTDVHETWTGPTIGWRRVPASSNWGTYTPAWTSPGTPPTLGNGIIVGRGRTVDTNTMMVSISLTIGSTTNVGSTHMYRFSIPAQIADFGANERPLGVARILHRSGGSNVGSINGVVVRDDWNTVAVALDAPTDPNLRYAGSSLGGIALGEGSTISLSCTYEVAGA